MRKALVSSLLISLLSVQASAQTAYGVPRFPKESVSGTITTISPPNIVIDGTSYLISPGLTVIDESNRFVTWGTLRGGEPVKWTKDSLGNPAKVWKVVPSEPDWKR